MFSEIPAMRLFILRSLVQKIPKQTILLGNSSLLQTKTYVASRLSCDPDFSFELS